MERRGCDLPISAGRRSSPRRTPALPIAPEIGSRTAARNEFRKLLKAVMVTPRAERREFDVTIETEMAALVAQDGHIKALGAGTGFEPVDLGLRRKPSSFLAFGRPASQSSRIVRLTRPMTSHRRFAVMNSVLNVGSLDNGSRRSGSAAHLRNSARPSRTPR